MSVALFQSKIRNDAPGDVTFNAPVQPGSLVIVAISSFGAQVPSNDVTDNQSNTYTRIASLENGGDDWVAVFYCEEVKSNSGAFTVTNVTGSSLAIFEYWGLDRVGVAFDTSVTGFDSSISGSDVNITPNTNKTYAPSLIFVAQTDNGGGAYTSNTNFVTRQTETDSATHERLATQDRLAAPVGAVSVAGFSAPGTQIYALIAASFFAKPDVPLNNNRGLRPAIFTPGIAR